jgi:hypothetical protein
VKNKAVIWVSLTFLVLGCNMIDFVPVDQPETEISPDAPAPSAAPAEEAPPAAEPEPAATPTIMPTPAPPTPTPFFLHSMNTCPPEYKEGKGDQCCPALNEEGVCCTVADENGACCPIIDEEGFCCATLDENGLCADDIKTKAAPPREPPRHGLIIALVLPLLILGIPGTILEFFVVRYVQPKGRDLSKVLIKAQDGLFLEAAISLTARRTLTVASTRMSWSAVTSFVEKTLEQELINEALNYPSLDELERNLKNIAEGFKSLQIVQELSTDFGVQVMRFNIEARYPQETMDALNRKAEAAAGGTAYLAFAGAAHLDPDSSECRELYTVYQETSGRVDAARNLGGGITNLANLLGEKGEQDGKKE